MQTEKTKKREKNRKKIRKCSNEYSPFFKEIGIILPQHPGLWSMKHELEFDFGSM